MKLVKDFGSIDEMPADIRDALGPSLGEVRRVFLEPDVTGEYEIEFGKPDIDGVARFLCDEREFSRQRVIAAMNRAYEAI